MATSPSPREDSDWSSSGSSSGSSSPEYPDPTFEAQDAPLLNIPPELRNRIYHLVLIKKGRVDEPDDTVSLPPLLRTCQQIFNEASQIYFANNKFTVALSRKTLDLFIRSLDTIGKKNARLIQSIEIWLDVDAELGGCTVRRIDYGGNVYGYSFVEPDLRAEWDYFPTAIIECGIRCESVDARVNDLRRWSEDESREEATMSYIEEWQDLMYAGGFVYGPWYR